MRIGFASEAFPLCIPHVIARRIHQQTTAISEEKEEEGLTEKQEEALEEIKNELKWRMKNAKRRAVPNAEGQVIGFNTNAPKETILDHNDPYKVEWTDVSQDNEYFVGEKVSSLLLLKKKTHVCKRRFVFLSQKIQNINYPILGNKAL